MNAEFKQRWPASIVAFVGMGLCMPTIPLFGWGLFMQPLSQAVLLEAFPPKDRGKAMGFWGLGIVVAPILGPVLGGWLTDTYSWRWVFYINLPFGLLAWFGLAAFMHETPIDRARRFDLFGFALLSLAIGALQMMLDRGESLDWFSNTEIMVEALLAGVALYMFVAHIFTHEHPFIEPALFRDRNFSCLLYTSPSPTRPY